MASPATKSRQPSVDYLKRAAGPALELQKGQKRAKLLVTDLNNCLLARKDRQRRAGRHPLPRPYLSTFLAYIAASEYKLLVWSSSRPVNVENMCKAVGILPADGSTAANPDLVGYWTRDNLGLTPEEYEKKTQVIKDLDMVFADSSLGGEWNQTNTVLMDDSDLKAVMQPYNHLHLPIFDPFDNANDTFDDENAPQKETISVADSFTGRGVLGSRPNGPALKSDQVDSWRRTSDWVSSGKTDVKTDESKSSSLKDGKKQPCAVSTSFTRKEREPPYKQDPTVFANFGYGNKRKQETGSDRYAFRARTEQKPRGEGPTAWPFQAAAAAASSSSSVISSAASSARSASVKPTPPRNGLPVGTVPVDMPTSKPSSVAPSEVGDLRPSASASPAPTEVRTSTSSENDTTLLKAIAALDLLAGYSNVSAAIRSGLIKKCFEIPKRSMTVEERLAALWNDRKSDTDEEDDAMSVTTMTGATTQADEDEWEQRGRQVCARLGVEVRKEFSMPSYQ